jgi:hypothetical protein
MHFEWCFGTFVPPLSGASIVFRQGPARHEDDVTPAAGTYASPNPCVRVASAAPAANLKRPSRRSRCRRHRLMATLHQSDLLAKNAVWAGIPAQCPSRASTGRQRATRQLALSLRGSYHPCPERRRKYQRGLAGTRAGAVIRSTNIRVNFAKSRSTCAATTRAPVRGLILSSQERVNP